MISFEIEEKRYTSPNWGEVTLSRYLGFINEIQSQRPKFLEYFLEFQEGEKVDVGKRWDLLMREQKIKALEYFSTEIAYWCSAPKELLVQQLSPEEAITGWVSLQIDLDPYRFEVDEDFSSFVFKGIEYILPDKHLRGCTLGEYADAANFQTSASELENGNWKCIADVIAVICRPKGEKYNFEANHSVRSRLFHGLTMDIVINVAFFLLRQNVIFMDNIVICSLLQEQERLRRKLSL